MNATPIGTGDLRELEQLLSKWVLYYDYRIHNEHHGDGLLVMLEKNKEVYTLYASTNSSIVLHIAHCSLKELCDTHIFDFSKFYRQERIREENEEKPSWV